MDSVAQQRTVVGDEVLRDVLEELLSGKALARGMLDSVISETFGFLSHRSAEPQSPASLVALVPQASGWKLSSEELLDEFLSIVAGEGSTDFPEEILAPEALLSPTSALAPLPEVLSETNESISWGPLQVPIQRLSLAGGVNANLADSSLLSDQQTAIRITLPLALGGNRSLSAAAATAVLAVAVRTVAEGGAMGQYCRSQVEQWCIDNNLAVDVSASQGGEGQQQLVINLASMSPLESAGALSALLQVWSAHGTASPPSSCVSQMVALLLQDFKIEEGAFLTARGRLLEECSWRTSDLNSAARDEIFRRLSPSASHLPHPGELEKISFAEIQSTISATVQELTSLVLTPSPPHSSPALLRESPLWLPSR
jgi:hypothetical protein